MRGPLQIVAISVIGIVLFAGFALLTWRLVGGAEPVAAAREVLERHETDLLAIDGVVGVGVGERDGREVIQVYVDEDAEVGSDIPATLEGVDVVVEQTGPVSARPDDGTDTDGTRSIPPPPEGKGDILGTVTGATLYDLTSAEQTSIGALDVEGERGDDRLYDAATVTVTRHTAFYRQTGGEYVPIQVDLRDLQDTRVEVWFTGPVAESYPVQATAKTVVVE